VVNDDYDDDDEEEKEEEDDEDDDNEEYVCLLLHVKWQSCWTDIIPSGTVLSFMTQQV
jgi:hypothetical protein